MNEYIVEKKQTSGGWTWAEPKGELIRCKDCKHNSNAEGNYVDCDIIPQMFGKTPADNHCSCAERKESKE